MKKKKNGTGRVEEAVTHVYNSLPKNTNVQGNSRADQSLSVKDTLDKEM